MKTFNETQMRDPWGWCLDMIEKHDISSRMLSEAIEAPRSTVRALYNGSNKAPRYDLLIQIVKLCIDLENGVPGPWETAPRGGSEEEQEWDFL